jgi:hypothetical protein
MDINNKKSEEKTTRDLGAALNDMLDAVKSSYGEKMFSILYKRIEKTLDDFDKDIHKILDEISVKDTRYFETLPDIKQKSKKLSRWKKTEQPVDKSEDKTSEPTKDAIDDQQIIERIEKRKNK